MTNSPKLGTTAGSQLDLSEANLTGSDSAKEETFQNYLGKLNDSNFLTVLDAIEKLRELEDLRAIPELTKIMDHANPIVVKSAVKNIFRIGIKSQSQEGISSIVNLLNNQDPRVQEIALEIGLILIESEQFKYQMDYNNYVVKQISEDTKTAINMLMVIDFCYGPGEVAPKEIKRTLTDHDLHSKELCSEPYYRKSVSKSLYRKELCPAIEPTLISLLSEGKNETIRANAAQILAFTHDDNDKVVPALLSAIKNDESFQVKYASLESIEKMKSEAKSAVPVLLGYLKTDLEQSKADEKYSYDSSIADKYIQTLGKLGSDAKEAIPDLIQTANSGDFETESITVRALLDIGATVTDGVVPTYVRFIERFLEQSYHHRPDDLCPVIKQLGEFGPLAKEAVPVLSKLLESSRTSEISDTLHALSKIGGVSDEIFPHIIEKLNYVNSNQHLMTPDERKTLAIAAADLINKINFTSGKDESEISPELKKGLSVLISCLKLSDAPYELCNTIKYIGVEAVNLPELIAAFNSESHKVRLAAINLIAQVGKTDRDAAIGALCLALNDNNSSVIERIDYVFSKLGKVTNQEIEKALAKQLSNNDPKISRRAFNVLDEKGLATEISVPALAIYLRSQDYIGQKSVIKLLEKLGLGPAAKEVHAALFSIVEEADARRALEKIGFDFDSIRASAFEIFEGSGRGRINRIINAKAGYILNSVENMGPEDKKHLPAVLELYDRILEQRNKPRKLHNQALIESCFLKGIMNIGKGSNNAKMIAPSLIHALEIHKKEHDFYSSKRPDTFMHEEFQSAIFELADALGECGKYSRAAIPLLKELSESSVTKVATSATKALTEIQSDSLLARFYSYLPSFIRFDQTAKIEGVK